MICIHLSWIGHASLVMSIFRVYKKKPYISMYVCTYLCFYLNMIKFNKIHGNTYLVCKFLTILLASFARANGLAKFNGLLTNFGKTCDEGNIDNDFGVL